MPAVISTSGQESWKNSYASSSDARLSLRVNGEERGAVITPSGALVSAGFDAPTVAPIATQGSGGNVPDGVYYYAYVYASSQYPFVESTITAGGLLYPRSNPSTFDDVTVSGGGKHVAVVVGTSQRGDVDTIFIYRTPTASTAAIALAFSDAGTFYYVGSIANDSTVATVTFDDNNASDTGEAMELDNFTCPLFRFTVCDGVYWWGFGNTDLVVTVTLANSDTFTISGSGQFFSGRNGLKAHIAGIDTGGFDGRGTFYFKATGQSIGQLFTTEDLSGSAVTITATGTATLRIFGFASTLYRSKRLNPFSWGRTTVFLVNGGEDQQFVSDTWAEPIGGGTGTGISLIPNERVLKLDTEGPQKSYALDLTAADSDQFMATIRTLDEAQSVGSQFSQFPMRLKGGQSVATGLNAKSLQILSSDATSQIPIGDFVIRTLRRTEQGGDAAHFYHGIYDDSLELNCWWLKTTDGDFVCDTLIYQHAPTGAWGIKYWPWLSASATIFDPVTGRNYTLLGDEFGRIGFGLSDTFKDWTTYTPTAATIAVAGELFTVTVPIIKAIVTLTTSGGITTAVFGSAHGQVAGNEVFIAGTAGSGSLTRGNVVVLAVASSTQFTFVAQHTGTYAETGGAMSLPFIDLPGVMVKPGRRYVMALTVIDDSAYTSGANMSVTFSAPPGIDIDTGDYGVIDDGTYYFLPGATACCMRRSFNSPVLSQGKQLTEIWSTQENVTGVHRWTILRGYNDQLASDDFATFTLTPVADTTDTSAGTYFVRNPPNPTTRAFGLDMSEYGYDAYSVSNFTIKMRPA